MAIWGEHTQIREAGRRGTPEEFGRANAWQPQHWGEWLWALPSRNFAVKEQGIPGGGAQTRGCFEWGEKYWDNDTAAEQLL